MSNITINISDAEIFKKLNSHKHTGPDAMPDHISCELSAKMAPSLSLLFKMSLDTGLIPNDKNMTYTIPVFKTCDKSSMDNYHFMSITSVCSKLMEHIYIHAYIVFKYYAIFK